MDETDASSAWGISIASRQSVSGGTRPSWPRLTEPPQMAESFKHSRKVQQGTDPRAMNYSFKRLP